MKVENIGAVCPSGTKRSSPRPTTGARRARRARPRTPRRGRPRGLRTTGASAREQRSRFRPPRTPAPPRSNRGVAQESQRRTSARGSPHPGLQAIRSRAPPTTQLGPTPVDRYRATCADPPRGKKSSPITARVLRTTAGTLRLSANRIPPKRQMLTKRSAVSMGRATSGGVTHCPPIAVKSSSVASRATAHPFQTLIGRLCCCALASSSRMGGTPTPSMLSRTAALSSSVASPASITLTS